VDLEAEVNRQAFDALTGRLTMYAVPGTEQEQELAGYWHRRERFKEVAFQGRNEFGTRVETMSDVRVCSRVVLMESVRYDLEGTVQRDPLPGPEAPFVNRRSFLALGPALAVAPAVVGELPTASFNGITFPIGPAMLVRAARRCGGIASVYALVDQLAAQRGAVILPSSASLEVILLG
jgi:hypothetical protein